MVDSSICNCAINVDFGGWTGGPKTEEHPKLTQDTAIGIGVESAKVFECSAFSTGWSKPPQ